MGQVSVTSFCDYLGADVNFFSSSTRGLDASTALEFVQALRIGTDIARITMIVSNYQAGE
jgi:ATP-binding cassette subfamily G (WHITE) protein 2 (SNQ2)